MAWALIVAYMLGLHNVYKQEDKTSDNISIEVKRDASEVDPNGDGRHPEIAEGSVKRS
jgi:hypothetical protein